MATSLFPPGASDVLYVIDLSNYVLRAYHAISELHAPSGEPTHAVHGMVNMLDRLLRTQKPQLLAVAMDSGRETFRKEIYPEYKANRPPSPPDLRQQLQRCEQIVAARGLPIFKQAGVEADDLIATLVERTLAMNLRVVIAAADKDLMQLVSPRVLLWDTLRNKVFGPPEVEERFGVRVEQVGDLLGLMGDSSDNIPGVPHIGPKTAKDLLNQCGTLAGVYDHLDEIKSKAVRKTLSEHREQAFLSRRLVELKRDCPIQCDVESLRPGKPNDTELTRIYAELGFIRQLNLLEPSSPLPSANSTASSLPAATPAPKLDPKLTTIFHEADLNRLVELARTTKQLALETFTTEIQRTAEIVGIALLAGPEEVFYLPVGHRYLGVPQLLGSEPIRRILGPLLADPSIRKRAYDLKRCAVDLSSFGLNLQGFDFDVKLSSYLLDPDGSHELTAVVSAELGVQLPARATLLHPSRGQRLDASELPIDIAARQLTSEVTHTAALFERLEPRLADVGLVPLLREMELPLAQLLAELEGVGVLIDTSKLALLGKRCELLLADLEKRAHALAGHEFNVNSPRQLETVLFDEFKLKPLKRTKTSRSTDHETLESLADEHPLPALILELRQYSKLKGTYIDALPLLVRPKTGRVHTRWEQAVAATGRLSSIDPNLQNIPIRTELGRDIRAAFVAPPGHVLVSADYSQIELRVLAHLSNDQVLLEAFGTGQDIHTRTAMEIFELGADEVTREHRTRAKAVNFGVIYGQGDSGLAKSLGISRAEAGSFIAAYFRRHAGVQRFMNETLESARAGEAVRSLLGRRRLVPDISSGNRAKRLAAERIAMNMPIQGTAADLLKLAMLALRTPVTAGTKMILTVHDELVFEVPEGEVEEAEAKIKHTMESVYALKVPLVVDVGHGGNWKDAH
ncbi:MAG: DNA polymerase I [Polyangiaceae bacterium]|nr:DNA polymerase I [Polyangiaceae bacterium]